MSVQTLTGLEGRSSRGGGSSASSRNMRETIHSGHFMVSDFEPESEAQDEEYEVGMPIPPGPPETVVVKAPEAPLVMNPPSSAASSSNSLSLSQRVVKREWTFPHEEDDGATAISIDGSLTKLFQCMSLAYRQKLTSPKWNRFKGVRLRWKDKIRLNNVIWRCWHMQFIMKKKTLVCQFASPLDVDGHNKPEAVVMEGKYWKRKLSTVAAEYKKWRLFYRNRIMGWTHATPPVDLHPVSLDGFDWSRSGTFGTMSNIIFDDDMFMDFTDTLFSSLSSNQPFAFPNPREIARAGMVADFIQPGLVQLQPNLDDFMDTLEPLHDYVNSKLLPPVPEELENFDPPDSLLSEDVLPYKSNSNSKQSAPSAQPFYDQSLLLPSPSSNGNSNNESRNSKLKSQHESSKLDVFAKPQGKPRGRSRSGGRPHGAPTHNQQLVNNANSNTLLSHLLAGSNSASNIVAALAPATAGGGGGSDYGMAPLNMIMNHNDSAPVHFQQQSPFHIPPPNTPLVINFTGLGGKGNTLLPSMASTQQVHSTASSSGGGSGGGSPTLGQHSPPMGPPNSNQNGPPSPSKLARKAEQGDRGQYKEHRRVCHINAEQKRRCNIKNGFDTLHSLIPQLSHNPNAKVSKAAMLAKGAEYIRQLKVERSQLKDEIETHRSEVEVLNASISNCQSMLPATGAPVSRQRTSKMNEMFHAWVRQRTLENWKFWLFSTLIRPLLDSYNNSVSTSSVDEMCRTVLAWVDQHCSLVDLRPAVLTSLRQLCTSTDILSNPANLQDEAYKAVSRPFQSDRDRMDRGDSSR